jgi:hypothetical protein
MKGRWLEWHVWAPREGAWWGGTCRWVVGGLYAREGRTARGMRLEVRISDFIFQQRNERQFLSGHVFRKRSRRVSQPYGGILADFDSNVEN